MEVSIFWVKTKQWKQQKSLLISQRLNFQINQMFHKFSQTVSVIILLNKDAQPLSPTLNVFYYKNYRTAQWILKINNTNDEIFLPT